MPLTSLESELRALARAHIHNGRLPGLNTSRIWGGSGNGEACAVCGKPIRPQEIEYEIEVQHEGRVQSYRLHVMCHAAWTFECARAEHLKRTEPVAT